MHEAEGSLVVRLVKTWSPSHASRMQVADTLFREIGILHLKDLSALSAHRGGVRRLELCIRTPDAYAFLSVQRFHSWLVTIVSCYISFFIRVCGHIK